MGKKKICIIEDDRDIHELIKYHLIREGYEVVSLYDGKNVLELIQAIQPDVIILDLMLPETDGLEICRLLRSGKNSEGMSILMLTAKGEESDIIVGLQMGADDYMAKPFSPKILLARIKALIRRSTQIALPNDKSLPLRKFDDLRIDLTKHKVNYCLDEIKLTSLEFDILEFLSRTPGRVFSREQILEGVWKDGKFIIDRAVDVHIRGLRKKMGKADFFIETVRAVGYRFKDICE